MTKSLNLLKNRLIRPPFGDETRSLASMGIYVFDAEYLYQLLEDDDRDEHSTHDFGKDIIPGITAAR